MKGKTSKKSRVLIVSPGVLGDKMAGPAIRYYWMTKLLKDKVDLEIVVPELKAKFIKGVKITHMRETKAAIKRNDTIVLGCMPPKFWSSFYLLWNKKLIFDLYIPSLMEGRVLFSHLPKALRKIVLRENELLLLLSLELGDFFLCANPRQRDLYLGILHTIDRLDLFLDRRHHDLANIIALAPFGLDLKKPIHNKKVIKGVIPGINKDDKVLIWGGGVWNWFDPLTLIRAIKILSRSRNDIKLFFLGIKHPTPGMQKMSMTAKTISLAKKLDLYNKYVFFNYGWVPYDERQNYFLESDVGVSCHLNTVETRFAFRTRILDYLWTNLPIVCTKGDFFAELVEKQNLGLVVGYKNPEQLAKSIELLLDNPNLYKKVQNNINEIKKEYYWKKTLKPLVDFCLEEVPLIPKRKWRILDLILKYYWNHFLYKLNKKKIDKPV